ncbi:response regulator transcription factor [Chitinophaga sancti]|uniref:response regulator transcription factor n=1 Tax=Chitinophaga sancti TaxID=1004 RepID=UPI002A7517F5|nr:response regulator transcription factor [Chitinophaga sancti]WPQ62328.1 response regulator transcription factor [Chitinophaga sancti]
MQIDPITVAIVDEHLLFRRVLCDFLNRRDNIQVVFDGACLSELDTVQESLHFNVLITDVSIYQKTARERLLRIKTLYPAAGVLLLSIMTDINWMSDLLEMGIQGCISKQEDPDELLNALSVIASGKLYKNVLFTEMLYHNQQYGSRMTKKPTYHSLSEREEALLRLLWEEKNNIEIAQEILLSVRSVEKLKQDLREKLKVRSVTGLLRYAVEKGIYSIDSPF